MTALWASVVAFFTAIWPTVRDAGIWLTASMAATKGAEAKIDLQDATAQLDAEKAHESFAASNAALSDAAALDKLYGDGGTTTSIALPGMGEAPAAFGEANAIDSAGTGKAG